MRGVRAVMVCLVAALALPGCMRTSRGAERSLTASYAMAPTPVAYAAAPMPAAYDTAYKLDAGDKLRVVVYGQEGLTNTYAIDAGGSITMPLIGAVPARGRTPAGLAAAITAKLRNGYIRDPSVAVEIESYRPFFILGEVAAPGQYPYVPNMSVESAVAIAGGFSPRARRDIVTLTHTGQFGLDARGGAARHRGQPRRYRARRRTLVLIMTATPDQPLRILHAVRAPVGGIFRHILDLANGQADRGHHVGIIADSLTGGERAEAALKEIAPRLKLGVQRIAIHREPHPTDFLVWLRFMFLIRRLKPDVLHGHGAKAGAFVRLTAPIQEQHSHLYAAWRLAALPAGYAEGRVLQPPRTRADEQHRSVPVRKRLRARHLSAHHRHAGGAGALRVQRRHRGRIRSRRQGG